MDNTASSVNSGATEPFGEHAERRRPDKRLQVLEGALRQALENGVQVPEAFAAYCAEAFARGDLIDRAVEFLLELFGEDEAELARLVRVPDLVTELAHGGAALTCTVASHWNANGEAARMAHLADMVRSAHVQMKSPHAVEVMLVLSASLGITRPSRARSLLGIASLRATPGEHDEALRQARQWVAAGEVVEDSPVEERVFWDQRLRHRSRSYTWETVDERRALAHLVERLDPGCAVGPLFQSVVPGCWWDLLQKLHYDEVARSKAENASVVLVDPSVPPEGDTAPDPAAIIAADRPSHLLTAQQPLVSPPSLGFVPPRRWPVFVLGLVIGGLIVGGLKYFQESGSQKGAARGTPAAVKAIPVSQAASPGMAKVTGDWCEDEAERLRGEVVDPGMLELIKSGNWSEHELYLRGQTTRLPQGSSQYLTVVRLLHLDLPQDPETRRMLPRLLALTGVNASTVELWKHVEGKSKELKDGIRQVVTEVLETQGGAVPEDLRKGLAELARE
ncbi:MAG: hypothetical protein KDK97_13970 [Verrucomicrobiales bacterium]|nr:hypothetical protein [Verrucomicrobiales bacterium]MCP5556599.1 hypothetical protein [Verrucomicrobiaceae bacterium]